MQIKKLEWLPSFNIGTEEIDRDHRQIFDIVVKIQEAIERDDLDTCSKLVENFVKTTKLHFEREIEFLARVGYEDVETHRKYHERLLSQAVKLEKNCYEEIHRGKIVDCYSDIVGLLIDDIVRGDLEFKSFLQEYQSSSSPKQDSGRQRPET